MCRFKCNLRRYGADDIGDWCCQNWCYVPKVRRWVKGQAQGLQPGTFKLWVN
jgi:hypothetical protein